MRKKLSFVLSIIIAVASISCVSMADESRGEIKFRDLEWGMTYNEVDDYSSTGLRLYESTVGITKTYGVKDLTEGYGFGIGAFLYNPDVSLVAFVNNDIGDVAGHDPDYTALFFAYTPINETMIVYDDAMTSLYGAQYEFETYSADDLFEEMEGKLESVYGERDDYDYFDTTSGKHFTISFWNGDNDTQLTLRSEVDPESDDVDYVYINYVWKEGDSLLQAASKAITGEEEREEQEKETSVNGL